MFYTQQLDVIPYLLIGQEWSDKVQKKLHHEYLNLEATLLRAKVLRSLAEPKLTYVVQSHIHSQSSDLAYMFIPFVFANINKKTIYSTPATQTVLNILNKYYQVDINRKLNIDTALNALNMYIDLSDPQVESDEFFYINLIKALCRNDIYTIFLITSNQIDQEKIKSLSEFLKVDIFVISTQDQQKIIDSQLVNMRKLLFKNKDEEYIKLCALFSKKNAELLTQIEILNSLQAKNFIEDMFYAEHIYEKLSVYAEYVQTQIQYINTSQKIS
ncbi:hypothetical protein F4V57_12890 [Acinetobacter qingfengensis]|uniref:Uncharacterized protein n=1 Tax=Acinetobacter qingfengensis TaxID=1262585 RepID=A0A1E7R3U3_9GAMM|nr:hypothetical protein [Acinetobacter qingfengensis]KAA8731471.1 hypothetical protein F4V57_12890 [Acinetobacter qingfengensis]OEY94028.1 hypothetical protein BJI46_13700 [Acinetobacter qingfengensis]